MDSADFNQFAFTADDLRDQVSYMTENMEGIEALVVDDEVIGIELPDTVELPIVEISAGRTGQLGDRPDQARHAFHRSHRPGSRASRPGRGRPGRYPHRRVPRPGDVS